MKTVYIAGKMSGDANYKQKFNEAQKTLEKCGFTVINPALMPSEDFSRQAYTNIGKAMLRECDILCLLSDWEESADAHNELLLAASLKKKIIYYSDIIGETGNDAQGVYYYKLAIYGNSDYLRRLFRQKYECASTANITAPSCCNYIIKTEITPDCINEHNAVNILASASKANSPIRENNDIAASCKSITNVSEKYVSENGIDIETAFARRITSPLDVFYESS